MKTNLKLHKKSFFFLRFLIQKSFTIFFICIILLACAYLRLLWKPIDLAYFENYLENELSTQDYHIDIDGMQLVSGQKAGLIGIKIDALKITQQAMQSTHILHTLFINISKRSLLRGVLGIKKISIDHIKSDSFQKTQQVAPKKNDNHIFLKEQQINKTISIYAILKDYLSLPLMRPLTGITVAKSNLRVNIPYMGSKIIDMQAKKVSLIRKNKKINVSIDMQMKAPFLNNQSINMTLKTTYDFDAVYDRQNHIPLDVSFMLKSKQINKIRFGRILLSAKAHINDDLTFKKLEIQLNAHNLSVPMVIAGSSESLKIKKVQSVLKFNPANKALELYVKHLKTNRGTLKGEASLALNGNFKGHVQAKKFYDGVFYKTPVGFKSLEFKGQYHDKTQNLILKDLNLRFNQNTHITGKGNLKFKEDIAYTFNATVNNLTDTHLMALWPKQVSRGARAWAVHNLKAAKFDPVTFSIKGRRNQAYPEHIKLVAPIKKGRFSYLASMKNATEVSGYLSLEGKKFSGVVSSAKIGNLKIKKASFTIPNIMQKVPHGYVKVNIRGALKEGLSLINSKPLYLMKKGGFGYSHSTGIFDGQLNLDFALLKVVKLEAINMKSNIDIYNGSLIVGKKRIPLKNINAHLFITAHDAKGSGQVSTYGLRSDFKWSENFNQNAPITTEIKLKSHLKASEIIDALPFLIDSDIPFDEYLGGSAHLNAHLQLKQDYIKKLDVSGNLKKMRLGPINSLWQLPIGESKTLKLQGHHRQHDFQIRQLSLDHANAKISVNKMNINHAGIANFDIKNLSFKNIIQNAQGKYAFSQKHKHHISLDTPAISFLPIIEFEKNYRILNQNTRRKQYPRFTLDIKAKHLNLYEKIILKKAHLSLKRDLQNIHKIHANIDSERLKMAHILIHELAPLKRKIILKAKNAGNLITQLGLFEKFKGGNITVDMIQGQKNTIGHLQIEGGVILKAPLITKLLSFASLSAILDRFNNRGLAIDQIKTKFIKHKSHIKFSDGLVHGSAIGMSFQGGYNSENTQIKMFGTLVPFYGLNSLLSNIPIIGQLTSSRKGEGIVGLSYQVKGKAQTPNISIDPLSILSIGILRRLFE